MSHISDAVQGVCTALDRCFAAYDNNRLVPVESTTHGFRFDLGVR